MVSPRGRFHARVGAAEFRFVVVVLTLVAWAVALWTLAAPAGPAVRLPCGYAVRDRHAELRTLAWAAPLAALAIALSIPVLFRLGRRLSSARPLP